MGGAAVVGCVCASCYGARNVLETCHTRAGTCSSMFRSARTVPDSRLAEPARCCRSEVSSFRRGVRLADFSWRPRSGSRAAASISEDSANECIVRTASRQHVAPSRMCSGGALVAGVSWRILSSRPGDLFAPTCLFYVLFPQTTSAGSSYRRQEQFQTGFKLHINRCMIFSASRRCSCARPCFVFSVRYQLVLALKKVPNNDPVCNT